VTVPVGTGTRVGDGRGSPASPGELLDLASREDFARWEAQLAATGNCANPVRLSGRIDAIDRATGESATIYDTTSEPGGVLRIPCGNRREDICPPCSEVYKGDARQIIRSGHRRTRTRPRRGRPGPRTRTRRTRGELDELTTPIRRPPMDKLLYRPKEAAAALGISKSVLYGLMRANRIRSVKDGKFRFITADALREYVRTIERDYEEAS
jgi:excisionase family DNA binding protein